MVNRVDRKGELWIFDMDGTMCDSASLAVPAFVYAHGRMQASGWPVPDSWSNGEIVGTFGMTHDQIWKTLLGYELEPERQALADAWILEEELRGLEQGRMELFPGVPETLRTLSEQGAELAVASNGQQLYIEGIVRSAGLADLFCALYSAGGRHTATKVELVRQLVDEVKPQRAVMVGDRRSDVEAGRQNGLPVIGCAFGFAAADELEHADWHVASFAKMLEISPW